LAPVQREVRLLQEALCAVPAVRRHRNPDAGRADELLVTHLERGVACLHDPLAERHRLLSRRDVLDHDGELVAAQPRQRVLWAQESAQALGHLQEHSVTDEVPDRIVDQLEPVQVEEQHRDEAVAALEPAQRLLQAVHEHRAVGHAGQRVRAGLALEVELRLLAVTDVADGGHDERAVVRSHELRQHFSPPVGAIGAPEPAYGDHRVGRVERDSSTRLQHECDVVRMDERVLVQAHEIGGCPAEEGTACGRHEAVDAVDTGQRAHVGRALGDETVERSFGRELGSNGSHSKLLVPVRERRRGPEQRNAFRGFPRTGIRSQDTRQCTQA
jgi:hypothetical protein